MDEDKKAQMDAAATAALVEFDEMFKDLEPDEQHGVMELLRWVKGRYLKAGYRRLLRPLFERYEEVL